MRYEESNNRKGLGFILNFNMETTQSKKKNLHGKIENRSS